jgi:hypothetical protein
MKMKKFQFLALGVLAISAVVYTSCDNDDDSKIKESNFSTPEEYIVNPSVKEAISESGIVINKGDTPLSLAGMYLVDGKVIDASAVFSSMVGYPINSEFNLYNQTASGKISFQEIAGGITASGSGGYITGDNGNYHLSGIKAKR